jgi:L-lactate utilization protein LutB
MVREEQEGSVQIRKTLAERTIPVLTIERIVPSLEDVFLYLLDHDTAGLAPTGKA